MGSSRSKLAPIASHIFSRVSVFRRCSPKHLELVLWPLTAVLDLVTAFIAKLMASFIAQNAIAKPM